VRERVLGLRGARGDRNGRQGRGREDAAQDVDKADQGFRLSIFGDEVVAAKRGDGSLIRRKVGHPAGLCI
jgi:hypothetical protein